MKMSVLEGKIWMGDQQAVVQVIVDSSATNLN
jgi:hypothetical protein